MKWISVKERVPQNNQRVLVYADFDPSDGSWDYKREIKITSFSLGKRVFEYPDDKPGYCLSHWDLSAPNWNFDEDRWRVRFWMPLPEMPHEM